MYRSKDYGIISCKEEYRILVELERELSRKRKNKHKSNRCNKDKDKTKSIKKNKKPKNLLFYKTVKKSQRIRS